MIKDYVGNKVIYKDNLICYFFDYTELDNVIDAVKKEKQKKLNKYGIENYKKWMDIQSESDLYTRFNEMEGVA